MSNLSRRSFLRAAALAGAATTFAARPRRVYGANDAVRLGFIGIGGRGAHSINWFRSVPGVRIAALCDVDRNFLEREKSNCDKKGEAVATFVDARALLDRADIDAVVISTTNHTHALLTIWACQAGKDVYVEKPATHNLFEGGQMVAAARQYNRMVQVGTQNRSDPGVIAAMEHIHSGKLGSIRRVRGLCYNKRDPISRTTGPQRVPETVDYNLWCGPAALEPLERRNLHYDWHWFWSTGNGDIGNQGPHELDMARWALSQPDLPPRVLALGGRLGWDDDGQTANTQLVLFDYKPAPLIFEVRHLRAEKGGTAMDHYRGQRVGIVVECEGGYFAGGRGGGWTYDHEGKQIQQFKGDGGESHARNFIDAVRSRKVEDLRTDVQEGVTSAALAHLGNISYRCGAGAAIHEIVDRVAAHPELANAFESMREHLMRNAIDFEANTVTLGAALEYDAASVQVRHGDSTIQAMAQALSTRQYRAPFVVPQTI